MWISTLKGAPWNSAKRRQGTTRELGRRGVANARVALRLARVTPTGEREAAILDSAMASPPKAKTKEELLSIDLPIPIRFDKIHEKLDADQRASRSKHSSPLAPQLGKDDGVLKSVSAHVLNNATCRRLVKAADTEDKAQKLYPAERDVVSRRRLPAVPVRRHSMRGNSMASGAFPTHASSDPSTPPSLVLASHPLSRPPFPILAVLTSPVTQPFRERGILLSGGLLGQINHVARCHANSPAHEVGLVEQQG